MQRFHFVFWTMGQWDLLKVSDCEASPCFLTPGFHLMMNMALDVAAITWRGRGTNVYMVLCLLGLFGIHCTFPLWRLAVGGQKKRHHDPQVAVPRFDKKGQAKVPPL